jgi:excisionase family DNA binding protein
MDPKKTEPKDFSRTQIMRPKEAAKYLGLHLITVYRLIKKGELPGFKVGGQWRFKKDLLDAWIADRIGKNNSDNSGSSKNRGRK